MPIYLPGTSGERFPALVAVLIQVNGDAQTAHSLVAALFELKNHSHHL